MASAESEQHIKRDFDRVVDELGHVPTREEYESQGKYDISQLLHTVSRSSSYIEAVDELGYEPPQTGDRRRVIPKTLVKQDFEDIIAALGRVPTSTEYDERGKYSSTTLATKFSGEGSYADAVQTLGYEPPNPKNRRISTETLKQDFERVAEELGRVPELDDYREHGLFDAQTFAGRFDNDGVSYNRAVQAIGYEPYTSL